MNLKSAIFPLLLSFLIVFSSCNQPENTNLELRDQLYQSKLDDIRLGDGVPLDIEIAIRWRITDLVDFHTQFAHPKAFDTLIIAPRSRELANKVAIAYPSVDSVFGSWREQFIHALKESFSEDLGEKGLSIEEVIIPEIHFPNTYTQALEASGMKERELEAIRQKNEVEIAAAAANKKRATAEGEVAIEHARMEGKLQQIQAKTEEIRRRTELAKAETQRQVTEKQSLAEKRRAVLLAEAEVTKMRALKKAEANHKRELEMITVEKQRASDKASLERELEVAKLCASNPSYASYVVNKELASKVQIAVLPSNMDGNIFGNLLKMQTPAQTVSSKKD
ncbi:MAG: SPFH domain-containing protein [Bacteroidia bacterium]|nr:SPFH domain-containing protein [Bacteroidia bacterium]